MDPTTPQNINTGGAMPDAAQPVAAPAAQTAPAAAAPPPAQAANYTSNPFLVNLNGLMMMFKVNPVSTLLTGFVGFLLIVLGYIFVTVVGALINEPVVVMIFSLILFLLWLVPFGAYFAIAGRSVAGQKMTTSEALTKGLTKVIPFAFMLIVASLMVVVGLILLIIPGLILMARLSLAGIVMFEENLGPIKSIKRSMALTKGHFNEMMGAWFASGLIGGGGYGLLMGAFGVAPAAGRYADLTELERSGATKPKVHWLNYTWLVLMLAVIGILAVFVMAVITGINNRANELNNNPYDSSLYDSDFSSEL